jgi:hypothetical protein
MHKLHTGMAVCALFASAASACAQANARTVIERAIEAQGGEAKVAQLRTMRIKVEGSAELIPGQPMALVVEDIWQMPDRYKSTSILSLGGRKVTQTQTIDGDKGWIQVDGMVQDMPKDALAEMKEQKYAEDLDRISFLKDTGMELSLLDEVKVSGSPAAGVLVKSKGHRDVKLYFDKETGLLLKREHSVLDPASGKMAVQEVVFGDYQEKDGLKHYKAITAYRDGKKLIEAKVTEIELLQKLDEKVFAKP